MNRLLHAVNERTLGFVRIYIQRGPPDEATLRCGNGPPVHAPFLLIEGSGLLANVRTYICLLLLHRALRDARAPVTQR